MTTRLFFTTWKSILSLFPVDSYVILNGKTYTAVVEEPGRKIPLARLRRGWNDNIKMYLKYVASDDVNWI
jgi:hypothetical protein